MDYRTEFEALPTELLYLICDYLTGDDIIKSLLNLNHRLNSFMTSFQLRTVNLTDWSHMRVVEFFKTNSDILSISNSVRILSLTLSNAIRTDFHSCANIELIFASLLDSHQLSNIFLRLERLTFVRPLIDLSICLPEMILRSFVVHAIGEKIIFEKNFRSHGRENILVCSSETMQSMLAEDAGIFNQTFIHFEHLLINTIVVRVQHIKLHIDHFNTQWTPMSLLINENIEELTLIVDDPRFEFDDHRLFSSLLEKLSLHCRLHFFLRFQSVSMHDGTELLTRFQMYNRDFFQIYHLNLNIIHSTDIDPSYHRLLFIYTSPFCGSKLTFNNRMQTNGSCQDYTNLTQLTITPSHHRLNTDLFFPDHLSFPNLISLKLVLTHTSDLHVSHASWMRFYQTIIPRLRFLSIDSRDKNSSLNKFDDELFQNLSFEQLHGFYLYETDSHSILMENILYSRRICSNIQHLKIDGGARLNDKLIRALSENFLRLKSLEFSIKLISNEQLDTIGQYILFNMRTHLHYSRIHFEQDNLTITSLMPSEQDLGQWLGNNYQRWLEHITTIELDRRGLAAWM